MTTPAMDKLTGNLGHDAACILQSLIDEREPDGRVIVFNPTFLRILEDSAKQIGDLFMGDIDAREESAELPAYTLLLTRLVEAASLADMLATHRAKYPDFVSKPARLAPYPR